MSPGNSDSEADPEAAGENDGTAGTVGTAETPCAKFTGESCSYVSIDSCLRLS